MGLAWNPWALPGMAAVVAAVAFAWFVFRSAPGRPANRFLALLLLVDAMEVFTSFAGIHALTTDHASAFAWFVTHYVVDVWVVAAYLLFVGAALDTPLVRPLRSPRGRALVVGAAVVASALIVARPEVFVGVLVRADHWFVVWGLASVPLPTRMLAATLAATFTFGLVAAAHNWSRAAGTNARRRARAYLAAFACRDAGWTVLFAFITLVPDGGGPDAFVPFAWVFTGAFALYLPLLTYGILSAQLFDIDLKLKWTLRRGTVAAILLGVFFVVSELAQLVLSEAVGAVVGVIAAGLLVVAIAPLQRAADKLADRAMPGVRDTAEYRLVRKREVYRAALEGALQDGAISDKERTILARLQDQLGLGAAEALALEREAAARAGVG